MLDFIKRHRDSALVIAIVTSVFSAGVSAFTAYFTYATGVSAQSRQAVLERLAKFDASAANIVDAGLDFIKAINEKSVEQKDETVAIKGRIRSVMVADINDVESLKKLFDRRTHKALSQYQEAALALIDVSQNTSSALEMRPWTESFGRVYDYRTALMKILYSTVGVNVSAANNLSKSVKPAA